MNSPARRNPKNPVHAAAQSNVPSGLVGVANHIAFSCWSMSMVLVGGVLGVRLCGPRTFSLLLAHIPGGVDCQ